MTITNHRCVTDDETPHVSSACHPATLSEKFHSDEASTILAAWSILLRDYYAPNTPTFIYLRPKQEGSFDKSKVSFDDLHSRCLSISTDGHITARELKNAASEAIATTDQEGVTDTKQKTAVLVLSNEQMNSPFKALEQLEV